MARGLPGVWSSMLSVPFLSSGSYVYLADTPYPELLGLPLLIFGLFVLLMGWYIHLVAQPPAPTLRDGEETVVTRHPTQKAALVRVFLALPPLVLAGYLLRSTNVPYVYPTIAFAIGMYLVSVGIRTYWTNSLTTYFVTDERVISEFRLLSLVRTEVPLRKIRAVKETKSPIEALVGVGNVRVSSGGGTGLGVTIRSINSVTEFADELRKLTGEAAN